MAKKQNKSFVVKVEPQKMRWCPDPLRRGRIIPDKNKKPYSRKAQDWKDSEPFASVA